MPYLDVVLYQELDTLVDDLVHLVLPLNLPTIHVRRCVLRPVQRPLKQHLRAARVGGGVWVCVWGGGVVGRRPSQMGW